MTPITKNINVSDRVENQLPEFIRQEDRQLVNFLFEYYKSQEKTGRPYDILNNLMRYLDLDKYSSEELSSSTSLLKDIGVDDMGQPTINGMKALSFRIEKLMPKSKWSKKSLEEDKWKLHSGN